ncbi:MAG: hypothetical protein ACYDEY_09730 [Acidimicrobiales bacterium]
MRRQNLTAITLAGILALGLAACGSSPSKPGGTAVGKRGKSAPASNSTSASIGTGTRTQSGSSAVLAAYSRVLSTSAVQFSISFSATASGIPSSISSRVSSATNGLGKMKITGGEDFVHHDGYFSMTFPQTSPNGGSQTESVMFIGKTLYIKSPSMLKTGKQWIKINIAQIQSIAPPNVSQGLSGINFFTQPLGDIQVLKDVAGGQVTKGPSTTLNGIRVNEYTATLDLSNAPMPPSNSATSPSATVSSGTPTTTATKSVPFLSQLRGMLGGPSTATVDIWTDSQGRVRRIAISGSHSIKVPATVGSIPSGVPATSAPTTTSTITLDFTNYGKPLHITVPPASQVLDFSQLGAQLGAHGVPAGGLPPSSSPIPGGGSQTTPPAGSYGGSYGGSPAPSGSSSSSAG